MKPERGTQYVLGLEFSSEDLKFGATLWALNVQGRRLLPSFSASVLTGASDVEHVTWSPDAGQLRDVCNSGFYRGSSSVDCLDERVDAVVDLRPRNQREVRSNGIDIGARTEVFSAFGAVTISVNGSYVLRADRQLLAAGIRSGEPEPMRLRGTISWDRGGYIASVATDYLAIRDTERGAIGVVSGSWTTMDFNVQRKGEVADVVLTLTNALKSVPSWRTNASSLGFGEQNESLVGRVVGVRVEKEWK